MPDWKGEIEARLAGLRLSPSREAEIVEELEVHLEDRHRELLAAGVAPDEARQQALLELREDGLLARGIAPLRQARSPEPIAPGAPGSGLFGDLLQDLRYGVRMLRRQKSFALAAVSTLALGIGANSTIFSMVNATLLQRLPVVASERLVYVSKGGSGSVFSYPEYAELRDGGRQILDGLIAWGGITASLNADGQTDLTGGAIVSGNYFEVLGVSAQLGRVLTSADDVTPGAHPVAVVSHGLWQRRFGGRPDIVGHQVLLNGHAFTVVGVAPRRFGGAQLGAPRDLYVPMMMQAVMRPPRAGYSGEMNPDLLKTRTNRWLFALGRMKPGVTRQQVEASLSTLATAIERATRSDAPPQPIAAVAVDDGMPGQRAQLLPVAKLLMSVTGAVLLIACANVANLLLSRATARRREIAVRLAIGASRARLVRQLLTESVLLASLGGALGLALAWSALNAFRAAPPPGGLPVTLDFAIDLRVLAFSFGLAFGTGILFGLLPALRASRADLVPALKDESFVPDERARRFGLKQALVVGEVAVSLALLVAAALFLRSLQQANATSPGFDSARLLNAPLSVNLLRYTRAQGREFYSQAVARVQALPGVERASVARIAVLGGGGSVRSLQIEGREGSREQFRSDGGGVSAARSRDSVSSNVVGPGYFQTLGIGLARGRDFQPLDSQTSPPVVIVNRAFVAMHFPAEEALGKRVSVNGPQGPWREIVGVVSDTKYLTLGEESTPLVYLPLAQNHETGVTLHVRTSVDPAALIAPVRRELQALEPNLPVPNIQTMRETIGTSLYAARMGALLLTAFGALAMLLAAIGVYGVLAFAVSRRTRELGVRMALGASASDVFALVLREGMLLVALGIAIGLAAAAVGARSLASFLYGVSTNDAAAFLSVPLVLACVALLACYFPARRAMRVDPMVALRSQ